MISKSPEQLQNMFFKKMTFSPFVMKNHTIYKNDENHDLGYFIKYSRDGYYNFYIGNYTIPSDFSLSFSHNEPLIRFGTMHSGKTEFKIKNSHVTSFSPSSFFVFEEEIKGTQTWKKGMHFHGTEIIIYKKYIDEIINKNFSDSINFSNLIKNYTYKYLPIEITSIIQNLSSRALEKNFPLLYLESKILEILSILNEEITSSLQNAFTNQVSYGEIEVGRNKRISLTYSDVLAIKKAHDILTKEICNPPTIKSLSKRVFLNEQKLKAGFKLKYHMSIGAYTSSMRISLAENLLSTTELSIDEIAKKIGYHHTGNFIKMFKKVHGKTPLAFRKGR